MTVYVDPLFRSGPTSTWPYQYSCHMVADTTEELHLMAFRLGLRRSWFQQKHPNIRFHHYDLTPAKRDKAIANGVKAISRTEFAQFLKGESV